jgi:hypothetical protein
LCTLSTFLPFFLNQENRRGEYLGRGMGSAAGGKKWEKTGLMGAGKYDQNTL